MRGRTELNWSFIHDILFELIFSCFFPVSFLAFSSFFEYLKNITIEES